MGDRFGIAKSTVFHCVRRVGGALLSLAPLFISWPDEGRARIIIDGFQKKNFPGVLGAIDGSHIEITAPKDHPASYINRKGFHSVLLQAVCDHEMRFLHCHAGEVGSMHDARVLRRSEVQEMLNVDHFPFGSHLIGDAAYPIGPHLITPYRDNGHLSPKQKLFNTHLSGARCTIERAFGRLKTRFRRLYRLETRRPDIIVTIIMMACILHNVCLMWGDTIPMADKDVKQDERSRAEVSCALTKSLGKEKRERIANAL